MRVRAREDGLGNELVHLFAQGRHALYASVDSESCYLNIQVMGVHRLSGRLLLRMYLLSCVRRLDAVIIAYSLLGRYMHDLQRAHIRESHMHYVLNLQFFLG